MNSVADSLHRALAMTLEMVEAATHDQWGRVGDLDIQRQTHLQAVQNGELGVEHRETLLALQAHNRMLLERAESFRQAMEHQLSQHQYNHRALRTYITAAG